MIDPSHHDGEHESILQDVVTGDRAPADGEVRELIARCPTCADALRELAELSDLLDRDAGAEREALRASARRGPAPSADGAAPRLAVAADFERRLGAKRKRWRSWPRRFAVLVPCAAALLLLLWTSLRDEPPRDPGVGVQLGAGVRPLEPVGEVDSFARFRWEAPLPRGGWYTLRIWADRREPGRAPALVFDDLTEAACTPSADELKLLPARIEWQVQVFGGEGGPPQAGDAQAWLPGS